TNSPVFVSSNFNSGDVVSCQMTSSDACVQPALAVSNSIAITVIPQIPQSVTISADMNPACPGEAITFTAAPSNGSLASTFQWKVNGTPVGNDTDVFVSPSLTNMDIVICEMTSLFPCVSPAVAVSNALTVSIVSSFAASVAIQADTTHVCQGTTVNFSALAVNGGLNPVYQWKVNGFVAGSNSPLFPVVLSNNDIVTCEMSSGHSCAIPATAVSNSVQVSVDLFVTPLVSITGLPVAVCYGDPVQFTPLPVFGGSSPLYEWYVNGIFTIATGGTYSDSTLSNQDQVYCVMTSNENCVTTGTANSNSVTVTVNAASVPVITETGGTLNSTVAVSYQWYFNSVLISGADNQSFTPPANGFYHVVITDANGCTASSALYQVTTVGIPEAGDNNSVFTLYPNPTGSNAILDITGKSGLVADLISVDGKVLLNVFNGTTVADRLQITIPCSTLANGVYFVRVIRDGGVCIKRLVVTR
ncbi:MAG TPA: T9SS type A sorting domain-containing protein, partial [Bacteroidia bacterium]|nr:T9SS type A sorting domain-containing protein [Bacteroidia bacterium]